MRKLQMRFDFARNSFGFLFAPCNYGRGKNKQRMYLNAKVQFFPKLEPFGVPGQVQSHFELFRNVYLGVCIPERGIPWKMTPYFGPRWEEVCLNYPLMKKTFNYNGKFSIGIGLLKIA